MVARLPNGLVLSNDTRHQKSRGREAINPSQPSQNKGLPADIRYQNSITYLLGQLAGEIRRLRIERSQIHPDDSDRSRGEMKTRKTTFVAILSQTLTTTSTFSTTSRVYSEGGNSDHDLRNGSGNALTTTAAPLGAHRWCVECATPMVMMSPELAATVCFQTTRAIYRLVEAGRVHFTDGPEGVMVCPASLMKEWAGDQRVGLLTAAPARLAGFEIKRT